MFEWGMEKVNCDGNNGKVKGYIDRVEDVHI